METKKNSSLDLESKRSTFLLYGLIISLTAVLLAFRGTSEVQTVEIPSGGFVAEPEAVIIPVTREEVVTKTALPVFKLLDEIKITSDTEPLPDVDFTFDEPDDPLPDPIQISEEVYEEPVILFPQVMPEFPGGNKSLNRWLSNNIHYPVAAQEMNIEGRVYLNFVVGKDGSVNNVSVTRGVDPLIDQEAVRLLSAMPRWKPGLQNGKPVKVSYNIFITFKLDKP
jgi:periplasmic protein TonB